MAHRVVGIANAADVDADYILVTSTHTHEARDTMGQWGINLDTTGMLGNLVLNTAKGRVAIPAADIFF